MVSHSAVLGEGNYVFASNLSFDYQPSRSARSSNAANFASSDISYVSGEKIDSSLRIKT